jgi:DNA-binding winged helix-turn-helix (wHTH) protein/tetratricopeptide (TPR) repeat protein
MDAPVQLHLRFDTFELDEREGRLTRDGRALQMPPKVFALLCALARQPGQLVAKTALLDAVLGHQYVSDSVLKTTVSELRAALGDDPKQPRFIETAARRGYRFVATPRPAIDDAVLPAIAGDVADRSVLIGRQAPLDRLHACWREAGVGRRRVVWLAGAAGIGKTTLIEHFLAGLGPGAVVAHGQCVEAHGAGEPYLPLLEAIATLCRSNATLPALLRSVAPTWLLQLPWLCGESEGEALHRQLAGSGQERMLRELGELLDRCAQDRPLLLVTEDLHWSDHATLRAIDHVARRRGSSRLMWLGSFRLAEVIAEDHPLKALRHELRLHRLADEIVLETFSQQEVAHYIKACHPQRVATEAMVRTLHARTDGLPLFLANVLEDWVGAPGHAEPLDDAWRVPESLAGVIERQFERLAPAERQLLSMASVCGVEFDLATLSDAMPRAADEIGPACDDLVRRGQWLAGPLLDRSSEGGVGVRYTFRHALYRQVVYQRIGAHQRARWHVALARSLAQRRSGGAAEIALHHELGHEPMLAARQYAAAAEDALRHFAPSEAMTLTERALDLLGSVPEGPERMAAELNVLGPRTVAASQVIGVTAAPTRQAFERLDYLCEQLPGQAARALELGLGWSLFVGGEYGPALVHAARKLALAERRGDPTLQVAACNLHGATLAYQGRLAEAWQWLERGLAASEGADERLAAALSVVDLEVSMRSRLSQVLAQMGEIDAAHRQIGLAHARVDRFAQPYARRLVLIFESFLAQRLDRAEHVLALGDALEHIATDDAIAQAEGPARWLRGWALARLGQPLAGHALIREGYALDMRRGVLRGRSGVLGHAAEALVLAEQWDEAQRTLDEARSLAARMGERLHLPDLLLLGARIERGRGDAATARESLQAARREAADQRALWLELVALVASCEADGAAAAQLDALAGVRARLPQGQATRLVQRADALLSGRRSDRNLTDS